MSKAPLFDVWDSKPLVDSPTFTNRGPLTAGEELDWVLGWAEISTQVNTVIAYEFFRVRGYSPKEAQQAVLNRFPQLASITKCS